MEQLAKVMAADNSHHQRTLPTSSALIAAGSMETSHAPTHTSQWPSAHATSVANLVI